MVGPSDDSQPPTRLCSCEKWGPSPVSDSLLRHNDGGRVLPMYRSIHDPSPLVVQRRSLQPPGRPPSGLQGYRDRYREHSSGERFAVPGDRRSLTVQRGAEPLQRRLAPATRAAGNRRQGQGQRTAPGPEAVSVTGHGPRSRSRSRSKSHWSTWFSVTPPCRRARRPSRRLTCSDGSKRDGLCNARHLAPGGKRESLSLGGTLPVWISACSTSSRSVSGHPLRTQWDR
jgi:hypothetical protein